jgi:predicted nucleotidyltransferase
MNLETLQDVVRKRVQSYVEEMLSIHQDKIISVALYGSAVGKDFSKKASDINIAIIFSEIGFSDLKKSQKLISKGLKRRIPSPLFLTKSYIESSSDVFPIEFLEMKENHITIYGDDILSGLEVSKENLRLECESQIKGKLIRIRQAYLEMAGKKKGIERLLKESLSSLIPVFKGLLRLKGITPPSGKEEVLIETAKNFSCGDSVFVKIFQDRQNDEKISGRDIEGFFEMYLDNLQILAERINEI